MQIEPRKLWLPRTGQTTTSPTANYAEGDDGWFQAGNPRATRFIDNGNGTISDRATGLQWVKQPELIIPGAGGIHATNQIQSAEGVWSNLTDYVAGDLIQGDGDPDALFYVCILANGPAGVGAKEPPDVTYWRETVWTASAANLTTPAEQNWVDAIANCNDLVYAGFTDWRLPNVMELFTQYDFESDSAPMTYSAYFPNTQADTYWTSTTRKASTPNAHYVRFAGSYASVLYAAKADDNDVRPVRGGHINA